MHRTREVINYKTVFKTKRGASITISQKIEQSFRATQCKHSAGQADWYANVRKIAKRNDLDASSNYPRRANATRCIAAYLPVAWYLTATGGKLRWRSILVSQNRPRNDAGRGHLLWIIILRRRKIPFNAPTRLQTRYTRRIQTFFLLILIPLLLLCSLSSLLPSRVNNSSSFTYPTPEFIMEIILFVLSLVLVLDKVRARRRYNETTSREGKKKKIGKAA